MDHYAARIEGVACDGRAVSPGPERTLLAVVAWCAVVVVDQVIFGRVVVKVGSVGAGNVSIYIDGHRAVPRRGKAA